MTDQHPVFDPSPPAGEVKPLLIESWLPVGELGVESVRERQAASALPPLSFLHVWWARRPLAACSGVQLASVLPPWSEDLLERAAGLEDVLERMRSRRSDLDFSGKGNQALYRAWVLWLCGVWGDSVGAWEAYQRARAQGRSSGSPFDWSQAYQNKPHVDDLSVLHDLLIHQWGRLPIVLDPTAGGGSIPYTASRFGLPSVANDLNPVAAGILEGTLVGPSTHGLAILQHVNHYGEKLVEEMGDRLAPYFELEDTDEGVRAYLWANTIACPRTGGPVPLSPNWWLDKKGKRSKTITRPPTAVRPHPVHGEDGSPSHIDFEIVEDPVKVTDWNPNDGSVTRGDAISPWDGAVIDGDWIKAEADAGRMWPTLYAVAAWKPSSGRGDHRYYRTPTETDLASIERAQEAVEERLGEWIRDDVIPDEPIPDGLKTAELHRYGMHAWRDLCTARQLLTHATFVEAWRDMHDLATAELGSDLGDQVGALLGIMAAKALTFNTKLSRWDSTRTKLNNNFERHDFAFKWSFGEFDGARALWPFCLDQLRYAYDGKVTYEGIARQLQPRRDEGGFNDSSDLTHPTPAPVHVTVGSATELGFIEGGSLECVNIDPPYYDNVMYAELADFFYVWEKRTLGRIHPDRFSDELTNKAAEAVANPSRFDHLSGRAKKKTANLDYQNKMRDIFVEARRVLRDDGVMTVWFTHKAADAWDTLGAAIMDAGFTIETSWPVNTESAVSLHQARVNAAKSTIILVCRKRDIRDESHVVFFEDIVAEVRAAAREAAEDFADVVGAGGVDLLLSTYGPALGVLSAHWPVMSSEADSAGDAIPLRPEEALDVARAEVSRLRIARLVGESKQFDPSTDFVLIAWDTYRAKGFPYDEARKLALAVGADVDGLIGDKVLTKKSGNVELADPLARVARRIDEDGPFPSLYDAICVMLRKYELDGAAAVRTWLVERGFDTAGPFRQVVAAYGLAVPRVRGKKGWTLEEARLLDEIAANVPTLELHLADPDEEQVAAEQQAMDL